MEADVAVAPDSHLVLTGSFNFTIEAEYHNAENLIFVASPPIAALYAANWLAHKAPSVP
jgi:phosphatidylserine/phosphatidylglycerophosphate/cardiolipin synthase-like enzyme